MKFKYTIENSTPGLHKVGNIMIIGSANKKEINIIRNATNCQKYDAQYFELKKKWRIKK